jgi:hypothetical protein
VRSFDGGRVALTAGETAEFDIPATDEWKEISFPLPFKAVGMKDLQVELMSGGIVELDWITFR